MSAIPYELESPRIKGALNRKFAATTIDLYGDSKREDILTVITLKAEWTSGEIDALFEEYDYCYNAGEIDIAFVEWLKLDKGVEFITL
ncbi:hypothetical protein RW25_05415 [Bacillus sp. L_1B0_8]|uniref:hypothetical protein n=1 Tax=unclassified Bacillus (in: firmicutes) TaxID=185979 RepID=UPI0005B6E95C|nr:MULTISPECIES: hypothetical protein [unclassified Bacillus (in: firmicutes)]KIQ89871.1 hypothetical protein RT27_06400 [Bacillus sp. L_1B0_5]KIQ91397.1 hypothetical protein RW25_05415 [Bacillus sp. L_1B0_8]